MLGSSSSTAAAAIPMVPSSPKHDVFLSFRGEDTRDSFTSHLYAQLCRKKIETFIDNRLDRGDEISPSLRKAIEESMIYVIIFSKNYASSSWCLDELTEILECRRRYGRDVIPVFYKVDPSSLRHQRGSYADAFVKHELRFEVGITRRWKAALTEAAGLSGWNSHVTRPESMLVDGIVEDILRKLDRSSSSDNQGMIAIDKHIAQIESLLHLESPAVRIIGIWGMGGIGKTTLARAVYHKLEAKFRSCRLVANTQQEIERGDCLRDKLGVMFNREKVLLILDDVNNSVQLKILIGGHGNFGQGSRIIVTSRDMQVLKNAEADDIYEVKQMNFQNSLRLFSLNAFKQNYPKETYMALVEKVLNYAQGVPLALKVLGSLLYGRTKKAWESELQKLEKLPDLEIFNVLKLSYDGLDDEQKDIFLDISCFYISHLENDVVETLDCFGFSADIGMNVLKDRCLISTSEGVIMMHDLIQEMAKEIVRQQGVNDPGKRSRLWKNEEICHVLRKNKGTDAIQCIVLNMDHIEKVQLLHAETFKNMPNLRMLKLFKSSLWGKSNLVLPAVLEGLPNDLKFLHWDYFTQRSLPLDFCPENLVKLEMSHSNLEQLWEEDQDLPHLKMLDLSFSGNLIRIPDLSKFPNIEEIILSYCESLVQVYSSSFLCKLKYLCLSGCVGLRSLNLPSNILSRSSGLVLLDSCGKLETFSISSQVKVVESYSCSGSDGFLGAIEVDNEAKLRWTYPKGTYGYGFHEMNGRNLYVTSLRILMPSQSLHELCWLDLRHCQSLTSLPIDLCKLKLLRRLYLSGCSNLEKFPEIEETMENLSAIVLDATSIQELPSSLYHLVGLEELSLHNCQRLENIPSSIGSLTKLSKLGLTGCNSLKTFPSSIFKLKLTKLDLNGCLMLNTFPEILEPAESFTHINLSKTAIKELPSSLDYLVGLQTLGLNLCSDLESLPNSIINLSLLSQLDCSGCGKLSKIPNDMGRLSSLRELSLQGTGIVNLPESIAYLSSLESLDVSDCRKLECIPQLPPFLKLLTAFDCLSIKRMMANSRVKHPSDSKEGSFKLHFINNEEQDPSALSNVVADARLRITGDAYSSVFYCFPGSAVPDWFPFRCEGNSVTVSKDSLNWCNDVRLTGFALCVVLQGIDMDDICKEVSFRYRLTFESDGRTYVLPNRDGLNNYFSWRGRCRLILRDHTVVWKYCLLDSAIIDNGLSHAHNFTFEISNPFYLEFCPEVKECGIFPLYTKEKNDINGIVYSLSFQRVSDNDFEEHSGKRQCLR
ncbi:disease resistance protein RPV1-like [Lotus japonicus]|uniref:disease resistance protein RPV1-like n=1 Tax=Lotus japonicus TaxID=34305 RepID=UPI002590C503|nr:disease resistance protein RPV1-like [Lotus japonicus]